MQLLFYLGIILPTCIIVVAFIIFLVCWFCHGPDAAKKYLRGTTTSSRQREATALPPLPLRRSVSMSAAGQGSNNNNTSSDIFVMSYCEIDDDGKPIWDKYSMRESMHTLYFGDKRPNGAIPNSVTFPSIPMAMTSSRQPPPRSQTQHNFIGQSNIPNQTVTKSTSCVFPPNSHRRMSNSRARPPRYANENQFMPNGFTSASTRDITVSTTSEHDYSNSISPSITYGFHPRPTINRSVDNSGTSDPRTPSESASESERPLVRPIPTNEHRKHRALSNNTSTETSNRKNQQFNADILPAASTKFINSKLSHAESSA